MEYHLNRQIRYSEDSKYPNLYKWFLQEYSPDGEKIGPALIPWQWSFHFEADELHYRKHINLNTEFEKNNTSHNKKVTEQESIEATLVSGRRLGKKHTSEKTTFSMLGTDRAIEKFHLSITSIDESAIEDCTVWGCVSFTSEVDFRNVREDNSVTIQVRLKSSKFQRLVETISSDAIDGLSLRINSVRGFYSEWSPSIKTDFVKILTEYEEQQVQTVEDATYEPPRLGLVGECDINTYKKVNLLRSESGNENLGDEVEQEKAAITSPDPPPEKQLIDHVIRNQKSILAMRIPLWIIALALIILLLR